MKKTEQLKPQGFSEQAEYLIEHFLYTNDSSRQQSETSRVKSLVL